MFSATVLERIRMQLNHVLSPAGCKSVMLCCLNYARVTLARQGQVLLIRNRSLLGSSTHGTIASAIQTKKMSKREGQEPHMGRDHSTSATVAAPFNQKGGQEGREGGSDERTTGRASSLTWAWAAASIQPFKYCTIEAQQEATGDSSDIGSGFSHGLGQQRPSYC